MAPSRINQAKSSELKENRKEKLNVNKLEHGLIKWPQNPRRIQLCRKFLKNQARHLIPHSKVITFNYIIIEI